MTSLFNLIEDPCKSMRNSSVKLNLFSSTILAMFVVLFSILDYLVFVSLLLDLDHISSCLRIELKSWEALQPGWMTSQSIMVSDYICF